MTTTTHPGTIQRTAGISHVAVLTRKLERFVEFYSDVLGARLLAVLRHTEPVGERSALVDVGGSVLHAFEQPDADPVVLAGGGMCRRGRIDHLGLHAPDVPTFLALRDRLVAVGASDGEIRHFGRVWSVHFCDLDGMEAELNWVPPYENAGEER